MVPIFTQLFIVVTRPSALRSRHSPIPRYPVCWLTSLRNVESNVANDADDEDEEDYFYQQWPTEPDPDQYINVFYNVCFV